MSLTQIKEFLKVSQAISFEASSRKEKYQWLAETLNKFGYFRLNKRDKSLIKAYLSKMTGYSRAQITRLLTKKRNTGVIQVAKGFGRRHRFAVRYQPSDIALLVKTDNAHNRLAGPATKELLKRAYDVFGDQRFERLQEISISHIYNLREKRQYLGTAKTFEHTQAVRRNIGLRKRPDAQGKPGYLRVDSVHQGDLDHEKGVYHINLVDEVTQWEIVGCVEKISEYYLQPLLEEALAQFPFVILGFHTDNGSEYINHIVAKLLNKLLIEQTKSRARQTNDNALVESKNGSVIRKWMGYSHIPGTYAKMINEFYKKYFNVYLNFHRPCGFATLTVDRKGKQKKIYNTYLIPYAKLKSLDNWTQYLAPGATIQKLNDVSLDQNDLAYAEMVQTEKFKLFQKIKPKDSIIMTLSI